MWSGDQASFKENWDDLKRTQKGLAKLVLGSKYQDYLLRLDSVTLSERRIYLISKSAKSSIVNKNFRMFFILRK